jgi:Tfp pilus assembly protein PilP
MKRENWLQISAYILVAAMSIGSAFSLSLHFLKKARAQDAAQAQAAPPAPTSPGQPPSAGTATAPADGTQTPAADQANSGIAELEGFLEPFIYDIVNRRDPFLPYSEYVPVDNTPQRALSPAQRWDLDQLKLVGIMWDIRDPKAMFLDPEDEVMILGRDESIGTRSGYIAAIREGEVVVVEAIRKRGDIIYRTRVLRIER